MRRWSRLWPPPLWRTVIRPWAFLPARFGSGRRRLRSGSVLVISSKVETVMNRRPGVVGLNFLIPIGVLRGSARPFLGEGLEIDLVTGRHGHHGLAEPGFPVGVLPAPTEPARDLDDVHLGHPHVEQLLHGVADHRLRGAPVHLEGVLVERRETHALLGDDRPPDDLSRIGHGASTSTIRSNASRVIRSRSLLRMSWTLRHAAVTTCTPGRLAAARTTAGSGEATTRSRRPSTPRDRRNPSRTRVLGSERGRESRTATRPSAARAERADRTASLLTFLGRGYA